MKRRRVKRNIKGRGIKRPYISKRNRLMLGKGKTQKGKKQRGGFIAPLVTAVAPAILQTLGQMFGR